MERHYYRHAGPLHAAVRQALPAALRRELHQKNAIRHFLLAGRSLVLLALVPPALLRCSAWPLLWLPLTLLAGFNFFGFTVLLHEVVHKSIFASERPRHMRLIGLLYGALGGLSPTQFSRWHMDHHDQLGHGQADPKRFYLSPRRNSRLLKLLYATPFLFFLYFRAAAQASRPYPAAIRRTIAWERLMVLSFHLGYAALLLHWGPALLVRGWILPIFFVFPAAFTLNRLGQHYVIDPQRIECWTTRMVPHPLWNLLFLNSSYHLEHHLLPGVPCYRLPRLSRALAGFLDGSQVPVFHYGQLMRLWFVENVPPHALPEAGSR
jgi:fatty acid desaturase